MGLEDEFKIVEKGDDIFVPSRFRYASVERFVPVLKAVLSGKQEIRFKHDELHLSAGTAMARVRDAAIAVMHGLVFFPEIDSAHLTRVWHLYKVIYDQVSREVVIELKHKVTSPTSTSSFLDAEISTSLSDFETVLKAYATLYGHRVYRGRLVINGILDDKLRQELEQNYNVSVTQKGPNLYILI